MILLPPPNISISLSYSLIFTATLFSHALSASFHAMGRPKASDENRAFAVAFAHAVTKPSFSTDLVARSGPLSLFAALAELFPMYARKEDDDRAFRDGITETQFNKELQRKGFVRVRDRRNFVTNRSDDPTGAGMYRFAKLQWRNPDDEDERAELIQRYNDLVGQFPLVTLGFRLDAFLDLVTRWHHNWTARAPAWRVEEEEAELAERGGGGRGGAGRREQEEEEEEEDSEDSDNVPHHAGSHVSAAPAPHVAMAASHETSAPTLSSSLGQIMQPSLFQTQRVSTEAADLMMADPSPFRHQRAQPSPFEPASKQAKTMRGLVDSEPSPFWHSQAALAKTSPFHAQPSPFQVLVPPSCHGHAMVPEPSPFTSSGWPASGAWDAHPLPSSAHPGPPSLQVQLPSHHHHHHHLHPSPPLPVAGPGPGVTFPNHFNFNLNAVRPLAPGSGLDARAGPGPSSGSLPVALAEAIRAADARNLNAHPGPGLAQAATQAGWQPEGHGASATDLPGAPGRPGPAPAARGSGFQVGLGHPPASDPHWDSKVTGTPAVRAAAADQHVAAARAQRNLNLNSLSGPGPGLHWHSESGRLHTVSGAFLDPGALPADAGAVTAAEAQARALALAGAGPGPGSGELRQLRLQAQLELLQTTLRSPTLGPAREPPATSLSASASAPRPELTVSPGPGHNSRGQPRPWHVRVGHGPLAGAPDLGPGHPPARAGGVQARALPVSLSVPLDHRAPGAQAQAQAGPSPASLSPHCHVPGHHTGSGALDPGPGPGGPGSRASASALFQMLSQQVTGHSLPAPSHPSSGSLPGPLALSPGLRACGPASGPSFKFQHDLAFSDGGLTSHAAHRAPGLPLAALTLTPPASLHAGAPSGWHESPATGSGFHLEVQGPGFQVGSRLQPHLTPQPPHSTLTMLGPASIR